MRCLEFFAGIGGFATAFPDQKIIQAIDIDRDAAAVYRANYSHPYQIAEIASLSNAWFEIRPADVWWMSPPCTPFTRKGNQGDLLDPRCDAFKRLVRAAIDFRPNRIAIENVVGFEHSQAFQWLCEQWSQAGYAVDWMLHCPSELGWPNRRPRFYAIASLEPGITLHRDNEFSKVELVDLFPCQLCPHPMTPSGYSENQSSGLDVEPAIVERFGNAMDIIDIPPYTAPPNQIPINQTLNQSTKSTTTTACFTSSYGKAILRSGSYWRSGQIVRRFSPWEIATLLGFPPTFQIPDSIPIARQWHLLGNSLSLLSVRSVFRNCFTVL